jgi:hypothetical protein
MTILVPAALCFNRFNTVAAISLSVAAFATANNSYAASSQAALHVSVHVQRYCEIRPNQHRTDLGLRCAGISMPSNSNTRSPQIANSYLEGNTLYISF